MKPATNKAANFFRNYPTGFNVFSVGKAGAASLILLQRLGAIGSDLRGKKVVISISPTWFFHDSASVAYYDGNFSLLQAACALRRPENIRKPKQTRLAVAVLPTSNQETSSDIAA